MGSRAGPSARQGASRRVRRPVGAFLARALLAGTLLSGAACEGDVRLGPKKAPRRSPDAGLSAADYELDLKFLGGRRHRMVAAVRGRDVRALLPRRPVPGRPGSPAFSAVPVGRRWERVEWRAVRVATVAAEGLTATVETEEGRRFDGVPGALLLAPGRTRLAPGQVVRVGFGRGLPYARVSRVAGDRITVQTVWLGELREVEVRRTEVLVPPAPPQPGAPVIYRLQTSHRLGSLVAADRKHRWVLGAESVIHRLPWTDVEPHDLGKVYPAGAAVRVALPVSLREAAVVRAMDGGLRYEVTWIGGQRRVVGFASLAPP